MLKTRPADTIGSDASPRTRQFLRLPKVVEATGLPPSSLYEAMAEGTFPKSIPIGPRIRAWDAEEVRAWQDARIAERGEA
jgi:prophage regulatory protein